MKEEGFSKKERLTKNKEFERVFKQGKKIWINSLLLIIYVKNNLPFRRLGIVVSKKIKKATQRNRVKRLIRELFRRNKDLFPPNCDMVIIPHPNLVNLSYNELLEIAKKKLRAFRYESFSNDKKINT
ncbi:MAG: ribonuclease P protein component [Thermodesulfobacteriota bacterium]|nr:MAG: ribonuclease P protein component [Thermodesulfobacteriota bacterium]